MAGMSRNIANKNHLPTYSLNNSVHLESNSIHNDETISFLNLNSEDDINSVCLKNIFLINLSKTMCLVSRIDSRYKKENE